MASSLEEIKTQLDMDMSVEIEKLRKQLEAKDVEVEQLRNELKLFRDATNKVLEDAKANIAKLTSPKSQVSYVEEMLCDQLRTALNKMGLRLIDLKLVAHDDRGKIIICPPCDSSEVELLIQRVDNELKFTGKKIGYICVEPISMISS